MENSRQVVITPEIQKVSSEIEGDGVVFIENAVTRIRDLIVPKPYNEDVFDKERELRWSRKADDVLRDGYVYEGKGCTDFVILFQAICEDKGYPTRFLRVKDNNGIVNHSMAEVEIDGIWYTVDVGNTLGIKKGALGETEIFNGYTLWQRGLDGWDVGLKTQK